MQWVAGGAVASKRSSLPTASLKHVVLLSRFVAVVADLTTGQLDDIIESKNELPLSGVVATTTTIFRDGLQTEGALVKAIGAGGLSWWRVLGTPAAALTAAPTPWVPANSQLITWGAQ